MTRIILLKERAEAHEVFMCIGMGKRLNDPDKKCVIASKNFMSKQVSN